MIWIISTIAVMLIFLFWKILENKYKKELIKLKNDYNKNEDKSKQEILTL